jgi:hypothetical protein
LCGVHEKSPRTKAARPGFVRVRSLRTQQRAESQCQVIPRAGACPGLGFLWLIDIESASSRFSALIKIIYGEFDPGSGRTLAACLTHASRARPRLRVGVLAANG